MIARNESKRKNFDPSFGPEWMEVTELEKGGITCQSSQVEVEEEGGEIRVPKPEETPSRTPKVAETLQREQGG